MSWPFDSSSDGYQYMFNMGVDAQNIYALTPPSDNHDGATRQYQPPHRFSTPYDYLTNNNTDADSADLGDYRTMTSW